MDLLYMMRLLYILINVSLASASTGVHLSYNSSSRWETINIAGTTTINGGILELTGANITSSCSWATYNNPIPLVENFTSIPASFCTHFTFFINTTSPSDTSGDGLAFFLSPYPLPKSEDTCGGNLGLFPNYNNLDSSKNQVVAVEFDTYRNIWDPETSHVGIDVNSIYSQVLAKFLCVIIFVGFNIMIHLWIL